MRRRQLRERAARKIEHGRPLFLILLFGSQLGRRSSLSRTNVVYVLCFRFFLVFVGFELFSKKFQSNGK